VRQVIGEPSALRMANAKPRANPATMIAVARLKM
jgi:hypothetical protein